MRIITTAQQKGGAAKTTTAVNIGAALAEMGRKVLLVDMDPQGHLAEGLGIPADTLEREMSTVLEQEEPLSEIIQHVRPCLDLAPANINLSYVEPLLYGKMRREDLLKHAIQEMEPSWDYVIIDCPPTLGLLTINALSAAHEVLIPTSCDYYSMLGLGLLLKTVANIRRRINPELEILGIVPTRLSRTLNSREVYDKTREELGDKFRIFDPIPETVKFREAAGLGQTIFEHAPDSLGAEAYRKLAKEVDARG